MPKIKETEDSRKKTSQAFLYRLFQGSIERWKDWSKNNIYFPYNGYQVGGLLHNKRKSLLFKQKQTKTIAYNKKKTNMDTVQNLSFQWNGRENDPMFYIPKREFGITQETANQHLADMIANRIRLEQNPPPKVAPASPRTAARDKKFIADALNAPLDIEHKNSYSLPSIIAATKEKQDKKRRTRAKRNTF